MLCDIVVCDVSDVCPPVLCFRVKFYATDPLRLKEEITRCDIYTSVLSGSFLLHWFFILFLFSIFLWFSETKKLIFQNLFCHRFLLPDILLQI